MRKEGDGMVSASRIAVVAWLLTCSVTLGTARAQDASSSGQPEPQPEMQAAPPGYAEAIEQALEDLRGGLPGEARGMFARAHELMPSARTLWGLGMAEFELRSYVDSIEHLKQALDSDVRPLGEEQRRQAEAFAERARHYVTRLTLDVHPDSAHVELDGVQLRAREALLSAGDHELHVSAAGFTPQHRSLHGLGGDAQLVSITLSPLVVLPPAPVSVQRERREDAPRRSLWKNPWLWTGVGIVIAGAALTGGLLAARDGTRTEPAYGGNSNVSINGI
jgi:hypothetical protein